MCEPAVPGQVRVARAGRVPAARLKPRRDTTVAKPHAARLEQDHAMREAQGSSEMSDVVTEPGRADRMAALLREAFSPVLLEVVDDSASHAGHAGAAAAGETHYTVRIVSERFAGLKRVDRSRAVHHSLAREFSLGLHALSLELRSPDELASKNS